MKYDVLSQTVRIGLLVGLLSQSLGCLACRCWQNITPPKTRRTFAFANEACLGSDGLVVLRFHESKGSDEDSYLEFSGVGFRNALRDHIGLAPGTADADGALAWPRERIVTMNFGDNSPRQLEYARFEAKSGHNLATEITTVRYAVPPGGHVVFPYEMDGVAYRIEAEFESEAADTPFWVTAGYIPCAAVDIVTFPVQIVGLCVWRVANGV